jgi:hypothetical protein
MVQRWPVDTIPEIPYLRHIIYHKDGIQLNMIFDYVNPSCLDGIHDEL